MHYVHFNNGTFGNTAIIEFGSMESASQAILKMHQSEFGGRKIVVKKDTNPDPQNKSGKVQKKKKEKFGGLKTWSYSKRGGRGGRGGGPGAGGVGGSTQDPAQMFGRAFKASFL